MNILKKMNALTNLTPNEKILVDYITTNPTAFLELKPKEIASTTYVSLATLYRLVNKLDLDGINELKLAVASSLKEREASPHPPVQDYDFPILPTDTHYQVMLHLKEVYEKTIEDTLDLADPEILVKVAEKMLKAECIDIYTTSANVYFAKNFQFQMKEINARVEVPTEEYHMNLHASNSNPNHLALIISFGGRGAIVHHIAKILKKTKTPIVLITSTQANRLKEQADYCIYMSSFENHYHKISSFSTRMTLLYILDTLYSIYFKRHYEENLKWKIESYQRMTEGDS